MSGSVPKFLEDAILKIKLKEKKLDSFKLDEILNFFPKNRDTVDWDRIERTYELNLPELLALKNTVCDIETTLKVASSGN